MEPLHFHRIKLQEFGSTGSGIFKNLPQNIIRLDLLVRECIQNSLDAADADAVKSEKYPNGYVKVCFKTGTFEAEKFNCLLSGIENKLSNRFSGTQSYIAIRDYYTAGLSGASALKDSPLDEKGYPIYSNYLKLVRDIRKNQENSNAGGSHGVGKTIYSKIGAGVVIYYSRFKNADLSTYTSRIAVCLIEDHNDPNCLLDAGLQQWAAGIANWGKKDPDDENNFLPIEDEREIKEFLNIFGIKSYEGKETGTSVVIPFIDKDALLRETRDEEDGAPYWTQTLEAYIAATVQRWYAPRLNNKSFPERPCLCASIEFGNEYGETESREITNDLKLFKIINLLHKATSAKFKGNKEELEQYQALGIEADTLVCLRGSRNTKLYFDSSQPIGVLAHIVCDEEKFMDDCGNLISPYSMINNSRSASGNKPIVMYTRKPGMIVRYQDQDFMGDVTCPEKKYIIALFMPNSDLVLTDRCDRCMQEKNENLRKVLCKKCKDNICKELNLEEYLRSTEASDHAGWSDINGGRIVTRIKEETSKKLNEKYSQEQKVSQPRMNSELASAIGAIWLPAEDFGTGATKPGDGGGTGGGSRKTKSGLYLKAKRFEEGKLVLTYECICLTQTAAINAFVALESGKDITPAIWAKDEGSEFPLKIMHIKAGSLYLKNGKKFEYCDKKTAELQISEISNSDYQLSLNFKQAPVPKTLCYKTEVELTVEVMDQKYQASINLLQLEEGNSGKDVTNG